jgi:hypothetical protein
MQITTRLTFGAAPAALAAFAVALTTMPAVPALADDGQGAPGVARLSAVSGSVQVRRGDSKSPVGAAQNAPVNVGDYLTTENAARAEVEFNYNSLVRLAPQTQIRFVKLDQNLHELQLAEGTVEMRVLGGLDAHPVVDTPAASIIPDQSGRYRVTVTHDGNTEVTVRSGKADVQYGNNLLRTVAPGSTLLLTGQGNNTRVSSIITVAYDAFDSWADARDSHYQSTQVAAAAPDGPMVGAGDLSQYGQWSDSTEYGQGWQPTDEPAGWAPYTDGQWVSEPYYGWTWVGNEPWGFAPYHYGRWLYAGDGWTWYPGASDEDDASLYAPALVGFFAWAAGLGNIGWSPLAPFEALSAWWGNGGNGYGYGGGYGGYGGRGGGFGNFGSGSGYPYRNSGAPGGAHGVSSGSFASGNFEHIQPVGSTLLGGIKAIKGALPIAPIAGNLGSAGTVLKSLGGITPLSNHFASMPTAKSPSTSPEEQRTANNDARPAGDRSFTGESSGERSLGDGAGSSNAWGRFDSGRGTDTSRFGATNESERGNAVTPQTEHFDESSRAGDEGSRTSDDAWTRFGAASTDRAPSGEGARNVEASRNDEPSYAVHSFDGDRANSESSHSFSEDQAMHTFSDSGRSYSEPSRSYSEPSRSYSEPSRSYSEPSRGYSAPRSYSAPSRSYSAPSRSYSAPSRSYSAPSRSYSAPRGSSGGSRGSSSGGHSSKRR